MSPTLDLLEIEHARFNARKTFSTLVPSEFEHTQIGGLQVTRDRTRVDSYYNRVLGLTTASLADLDQALAWVAEATGAAQTVRLDIREDAGLGDSLSDWRFTHTDSLIWLRSASAAHVAPTESRPQATDVKALTPADWAPLRDLLEAHGPITNDIWLAKRTYLCTDTFRWVGIFDGDLLVSAASTWISGGAAILGSAYTRPAWRCRGYQRHLLDHRRRVASGNLLVDVEPESASHRNCLRSGFTHLEHREVWERQLV